MGYTKELLEYNESLFEMKDLALKDWLMKKLDKPVVDFLEKAKRDSKVYFDITAETKKALLISFYKEDCWLWIDNSHKDLWIAKSGFDQQKLKKMLKLKRDAEEANADEIIEDIELYNKYGQTLKIEYQTMKTKRDNFKNEIDDSFCEGGYLDYIDPERKFMSLSKTKFTDRDSHQYVNLKDVVYLAMIADNAFFTFSSDYYQLDRYGNAIVLNTKRACLENRRSEIEVEPKEK